MIALGLTLTMSIATVVCCPKMVLAQTGEVQMIGVKDQKAVPSCHAPKAEAKNVNTEKAPAGNDCTCCITKQFRADCPTQITLNIPHFYITLINAAPQLLVSEQNEFDGAYLHGPPGPASEIPLYISYHNFRI